MENRLQDLLQATKVETLIKDQTVISVNSENSVEETVKILSRNNVLCVPVTDKKTNECLGVVDFLDILAFVISVAPEPAKLTANDLRSLEIAGRAMAFESVKRVMDKSKRNPFVPLYIHNPASMVVDLFRRGIHRVPIVDENMAVLGTVSQTDILKLVHNAELDREPHKILGDMTLRQLGLGSASICTLAADTTVMQTMLTMNNEKVSGVALVHPETKKLTGNFSARDLKGLYDENMPSLLAPVNEFLERFSPKSLTPVVVRLDTTFRDLVAELVNSKLHRLWVVDDEFKPIGAVSLTDIMNVIINKTIVTHA